jgi:sn1-specific diacylglycerol lipase
LDVCWGVVVGASVGSSPSSPFFVLRHGKLKEIMEGEYKDYRLRIVGHSLGAGCAAVLSVMLRPVYPNLRCLAFSPPGCVFSENLAEDSSPWLTSYILDVDIVPRLAIGPFEDLRDSVLQMIYRIKVPKYQVFERTRMPTVQDREELAEENKRILYDEDEVPDSEFKRQVDLFLEFQAELKEKSGPESYIGLYPPGTLIQLFCARDYKNMLFRLNSLPGSKTKKKEEKSYVARWIQREDLQHIMLSTHIVSDHEPGNVKHQIQKVARAKFDLTPPVYKIFDDLSQA